MALRPSSSLPLQGVALRGELPPASAGHPWNIPAVRTLERRLDFTARITFIVGENGSGKSTLVEAIAVACGFNAEGGSRNFNFATRASHSRLHERLELIRSARRARNGFFLRAESFFNVITTIEALDAEPSPSPKIMPSFTGKHDGSSLHERSHGESFFDLLMHRFGANGLYLLDEPESALSAHRQLAALRRFHDLAAEGSQFVIATHSPLLLAYPQAQILVLDERGITPTPYDEVPVVWLYRSTLANPRAVMGELLADDPETELPGPGSGGGRVPDRRGTGA
jgi:predicted ATPase